MKNMKFKWIIAFKGFEIPTIGLILFLIVFIWSLGIIIAPLILPPGSVEDLTGKVGSMENTDQTRDMNPYAKHYYDAGDANCHTIKERSYFINGNQMPFCARDLGIFFGLAFGLLITLFIRIELKWWWLVYGLVPIGLDGGIQLLSTEGINLLGYEYVSINPLRLLTGGLAGLVCTLALGYVIYDTSKAAELKKARASEPQPEEEPNPYFHDERKRTEDQVSGEEIEGAQTEDEKPMEAEVENPEEKKVIVEHEDGE
jgi:uncharacterized membrane protein